MSLGLSVEDLMAGAARTSPPRTAAALLGWVLEEAPIQPEAGATVGSDHRAGVCWDKDEAFMHEAMSQWLKAWKREPDHPRRIYEEWLAKKRSGERRAGGLEAGGGALGWAAPELPPKAPPPTVPICTVCVLRAGMTSCRACGRTTCRHDHCWEQERERQVCAPCLGN